MIPHPGNRERAAWTLVPAEPLSTIFLHHKMLCTKTSGKSNLSTHGVRDEAGSSNLSKKTPSVKEACQETSQQRMSLAVPLPRLDAIHEMYWP